MPTARIAAWISREKPARIYRSVTIIVQTEQSGSFSTLAGRRWTFRWVMGRRNALARDEDEVVELYVKGSGAPRELRDSGGCI